MWYLECGPGGGFERLEEKRTSRQHSAMDVLMDEGQNDGWIFCGEGIVAGADPGNFVYDCVIQS